MYINIKGTFFFSPKNSYSFIAMNRTIKNIIFKSWNYIMIFFNMTYFLFLYDDGRENVDRVVVWSCNLDDLIVSCVGGDFSNWVTCVAMDWCNVFWVNVIHSIRTNCGRWQRKNYRKCWNNIWKRQSTYYYYISRSNSSMKLC